MLWPKIIHPHNQKLSKKCNCLHLMNQTQQAEAYDAI